MSNTPLNADELERLTQNPCIRCYECAFTADVDCQNPYKECSICAVIRQLAKDFVADRKKHELQAKIDELERGKIKECTCDEISVADCDSLWHHRNKIDERIADLTLKEHKEEL